MNKIRNITKEQFLKVYNPEVAKATSKQIKREIDRLKDRFDECYSITTNGEYTVLTVKSRVDLDKKRNFPILNYDKDEFVANELLINYVGKDSV